jgi:hypothetical protein
MGREKLIRNLKHGDEIQVTDATKDPPVRHRVRVTHVQQGRRGVTGRRTWHAHFAPALIFGSWDYIWGYADDRIEVL